MGPSLQLVKEEWWYPNNNSLVAYGNPGALAFGSTDEAIAVAEELPMGKNCDATL